MNRKFLLLFLLSLLAGLAGAAHAQTLYVDPVNGRPEGTGTSAAPLASLEKAVALTHEFSGTEPVVIKLLPGLYVLAHQLEIKTHKAAPDTVRYTVEAALLPDAPDWAPGKMPVIQSIAANGSVARIAHATSFLLAKSNVRFQGLKFVGSANPAVQYYYPITRESEVYQGLAVSQCYFIGERNSAPIQGAIWVYGTGTVRVDHSIFYGCKNALIIGRATAHLALTNSVICGAYEAAMWYRPAAATFTAFTFRNNVVANCDYFWVVSEKPMPPVTFRHSVITGIAHYVGVDSDNGLLPAKESTHRDQDVRTTGPVLLSEVKTEGLPGNYLNPLPQSAGYDLQAGIFKARKR